MFDYVVDASGTYTSHNSIGPGGTLAIGEQRLEKDIEYLIPGKLSFFIH